jgi:hypothetical protein
LFQGSWKEAVRVTVTDVTGNIVYNIDQYFPDQPLNLGSALATGMYYVIVNAGGNTYTQKIMKGE